MATEILRRWRDCVSPKSCLLLILSTLILVPSLLGQSATTGALSGTVKDSSGAVVPNATVTVINTGTNQARTTTTSPEGIYKFGFLPAGTYRLKFEASGFGTTEVPSVTVNVTEAPVFDQTLSVSGQAQQVEVRGETEAVQTASSTVGTVVSGRTLVDLPLTSRNYTALLGLAAGANSTVANAASIGRGSTDISVNGSSFTQNNYQQDGASIVSFAGRGNVNDAGGNVGVGIVNPDAIQEFKIQTSQFDAGYGRNPGANVNVVTKGGTNQYHGTAFEFFRNSALNANDYFRKQNPAPNNSKQVLDQHQFGGTIGGPVKKDKLFFFASYQETRQKNGVSSYGYSTPTLVGIPLGDRSNTAAFRAGLGSAFCPTGTANAGTTGRTSIGGTQVACNGSNINPVAINLLQLKNPDGSYYIPSSSNGQNQNSSFSIPALYTEHQAIGNFDYLINNNNTVTGRWFYSRVSTVSSMGCSNGTTVTLCLPGGGGTINNLGEYAVLKLTSILSNSVVNEARLSIQRTQTVPNNDIPFTDTQVGIAPITPSMNVLNGITISGLMQMGGTLALANIKYPAGWQTGDQISWSHGKHSTRAGFEFERYRVNTNLAGASIGSLSFQTFQDFLLGLPGCAPGTSAPACAASATAGLTNGTSSSNISSSGSGASLAPPGGINHYYRSTAASAFVQDDYKVLSSLTLNLGMRWEYNGMISDKSGNLTNIWPQLINTVPVPGSTAATGSLAGYVVPANYNFAANPAPPVGGVFQNDKNIPTQNSPSIKNFAPRIGFAWKPFASDRFVVRGGGGYFYDRLSQSSFNKPATQAPPYSVTVGKSGSANYASTLAQPYDPAARLGWTPRTINLTTGASSNLNSLVMDPIFLNPTTYQWNLNIQYEFLPKWVVEIGYVGSRSIHQTSTVTFESQINGAKLASVAQPINGVTTNTVGNASIRVPYLGFSPGGLGTDRTRGDDKFNSIQATVRKQFSHGLQMQAAYSYSRSFDTATYNNFNDPLVSVYGPNSNYRPHRLTINYSYELPFGQRQGFIGKVANGWSIAGVTVIQNGSPLTIIDTRGGTIYGFGGSSPVQSTAQFAAGKTKADVATTGDIHTRLGGVSGGVGYFDPNAFGVTPILGTFPDTGRGYGNSGLGIVLGPGQLNFDGTLQKITRVGGIREDANLVFRAEFFNMFNHAQFSNPTGAQTDISKSNFGQITSTSVNPRLIQFALKYVF